MRIKEISELFLLNAERMSVLNIETKFTNNARNYSLSGLNSFRQAVRELNAIDTLQLYTTPILSSWMFQSFDDEMIVTEGAWDKISEAVHRLRIFVPLLRDVLSEYEVAPQDGIAIRLPPTRDFDEMAAVANDLKRAISIPISEKEIGGTINITAVDNGSWWLYVTLGTPTALALVGAIAWAAAVIFKKWQEALANRAYVKNLNLQNDAFESIVQAQKTQIDAFTLEQVKEVESQFFKSSDPELTERLRMSIVTFQELIEKGLQVEPSMLSSEQASNVFPDFKSLPLEPATTKQLDVGEQNPGV